MNKTNYHSHCDYCDGKAPMEEFVKRAVEEGFTGYGISSHSPLPLHAPWVLDKGDVESYIKDIELLKVKYKGIIDIYTGMEIDYIDEDFNPASEYFRKMPLDFRIGSVHFVRPTKDTVMDIDTHLEVFRGDLQLHYGGDVKRLSKDYFDASMRMVETGGFDFIGHGDKLSINVDQCVPGTSEQKWFTDMVNEYFAFVAEKGTMMEINTKRYNAKGYFFPNAQRFRIMREMGIPVLVNSDAHRPELINDNRDTALGLLKEAGFTCVRELSDGRWIDVEIG